MSVLLQIALWVAGISVIGLSFCGGVLWRMSREDKKLSARVIRPANITVNRHYHVTEYVVKDDKTLDVDFPDSKAV